MIKGKIIKIEKDKVFIKIKENNLCENCKTNCGFKLNSCDNIIEMNNNNYSLNDSVFLEPDIYNYFKAICLLFFIPVILILLFSIFLFYFNIKNIFVFLVFFIIIIFYYFFVKKYNRLKLYRIVN